MKQFEHFNSFRAFQGEELSAKTQNNYMCNLENILTFL